MEAEERSWETRPPQPAPETSVRRMAIVRRAVKAWASQIIDFGGRNNLLFYRDLKVGTIDLTPSDRVDESVVRQLLDGRVTRLSRLVAHDDLPAFARRARRVRDKADENYEERGLQTLFLAHGMATWTNTRSESTPAAPVALAPLRLSPRGGVAEDFDLDLDGDWEVNPILLHILRVDFGLDLDADDLLADDSDTVTDGAGADPTGPVAIHEWLIAQCGDVPGFSVTPRVIVGNFSYAKQPLALDIETSVEAIARHPVVAAIAGDEDAQRELIDTQPVADISEPDHTPPADEFLILDADASQSYVINAAVMGANLVVQGPPGTGKSQTIANLIATLAARGLSTLFVAEKRAAIDAVTNRLTGAGLDTLLIDLHGGTGSKRAMLQQVARALDAIGSTPAVDRRDEDERLVDDRAQLNSFEAALHDRRGEDGLSVFEMQSELLGVREDLRSDLTLPRSVVEPISWDDLRAIEADVAEWVRLDGTLLGTGVHPWEEAAGRITSTEQAEQALELTQRLTTATIPDAAVRLGAVAAECGLRRPATIAEWSAMITLLNNVDTTLRKYDPGIFDADLDRLARALAPSRKGAAERGAAAVFSGRYRRSRKEMWALARIDRSPAELLAGVEAAGVQRTAWAERSVDGGLPRSPDSLAGALAALDDVTSQLAALGTFIGNDHLDGGLDDAREATRALVEDRTMLFRLARLHEIRAILHRRGLGGALDEVIERRLGPDDAAALVRSIWLRSTLDLIGLTDDEIATFDGTAHTDLAGDFARRDRDHIADGAQRVLRRVAERAVDALNEHPDQAQLLRQQAGRRRGHLPLRELLTRAPDVLIAVKPCWAMSPLIVSQLLPSDPPLFDVVIFDEASQIPPAEAVPSVLRGKRLIVAGDSRQLPPTTFFSTTIEGDDHDFTDPDDGDPEDHDLVDGGADLVTEDMESILDSMVAMLPPPHGSKTLAWHYRSRDERLIAFSNAQPSLYDWTMTTFPGVGIEDAIRHVEVQSTPDGAGRGRSDSDEVRAVVDLVVEHSRVRPDETLGVITMGIRHADRIDETLRLERKVDDVLDAFLAGHPGEPFFVKNLERVQGDERDDIILSIGYGKNADGQMVYRFGPLNQQGGERRLNVAITRAREQMTVVSSFGPGDLDDDRLHAEGAKMLKRYLTYAASGGADLGAVARSSPALNPFEADVLRCLTDAGMPLTPQLGVSGYSIDFAAAHPDEPGRYVLAIEADGASYHSSATARDRDRLRQEHLERLGWRFHRIWSTEWFRNRDREVERAIVAWREAVAEANGESGSASPGLPPPPTSAEAADAPTGDAATVIAATTTAATESPESAAAEPERRLPRPLIREGEPITAYSDGELDAIVGWIRSDTLLRTDDELLDVTVRELGYRRKGKRIVAAVRAAIDRTRPAEPSTDVPPEQVAAESTPLPPPLAPGDVADWYPDPTGRFDHRYWDGEHWTENASRNGEIVADPI